MKIIILIVISIFSFNLVNGQTYYRGLERMCWKNSKGKLECYDEARKWYHENTIMIENDSIFIYKSPLHISKGRKLYSASDGAYYYYFGIIKNFDSSSFAYLTNYNCDYCLKKMRIDTATGFQYPVPILDTLKIKLTDSKIQIGSNIYKKLELEKNDFFPSKSFFYFDSNSITRQNPKGQYKLISQGIKNFLETKELKLDNDTLRICVDRYYNYNENNLIEILDKNKIKIDSSNLILKFYTNKQLNELKEYSNKPIRIIIIDDIVDHWKTARISLTYKIILTKNTHDFSEREFNNSFHYNKVGQSYLLIGELPVNMWGLIQKK